MAMSIEKYRGFEVEILYLVDNNMYRDRGYLTDVSDQWLELQKGAPGPGIGELLVIPSTAVRLMKIITPPTREGSRLLRPARPVVEAELVEPELIGEER